MNDMFARPGDAAVSAEQELECLRARVSAQTGLVELCRRINDTEGLDALLALLGEEVGRAGLFDGFLVTLPDAAGQHLVWRHVAMPAEYANMESVYLELKFALAPGSAHARAFHGGQPVYLRRDQAADEPELVRTCFESWRIGEAAILPLGQEDRVRGALFGFVQQGRLDPARAQALQARLALFAGPIGTAVYVSSLLKREEEVRAAAAERDRFLDLVQRVTELNDVENIYDVIAREVLEWLPFDMCSITLKEGDLLRVKRHATLQPHLQQVARDLDAYCSANPFRPEVAEGALASTFLSNREIFIDDVMKLLHLPMAEKDRQIIRIMVTPRSMLYVPIRRDQQPVGMLCLFTLGEPVQPAASELRLLTSLCGVIGTAIGNAELYSTVERQRHEIEQALNALTRTQAQLREAEEARLSALLQAKEAAEASAAAKSAFVANTSHEIRTPLTAIIGFAESLVETSVSGSYAEQWAGTILRNGRHLLGLINDILDVSKIEAGRISLEALEFSPLELVEDLVPTVAMLAQGKDLEFRADYRFPLPGRMLADPTRLRQVLLNLLNNAVKFTERGSVALRVCYDAEAGRLRFQVTDTGIGIPAEVLDKVFQPFTQADASTSRRFGGTGLGLHITRNLVELMGGELRASSRVGEGSCFEFSLPLGVADAALVEALPERAPEPAVERLGTTRLSGTVLMADDSPDNRQLVSMYVNATGALITTVTNGEEAVSEALTRPYDLVLLDIQMPVMNGLEAARTLRELKYAGPIYALTANVGEQDVREYLAAGFDGCLAKPIDRRAFFQMLEQRLMPTEGMCAVGDIDISELEQEFARQLPEYVERIATAFQREDWSSVAAEAHRLKGTAGSLGRPDLTVAAAAVEQRARLRAEAPAEQPALEAAMAALTSAAAIPRRE